MFSESLFITDHVPLKDAKIINIFVTGCSCQGGCGNLGGMVRQLSLDQFENESRRMIPVNNDLPYPTKKFTRKKSPQGLHKKASIV